MYNLHRETKEHKNVGYFYNFRKTGQRKQSPIGRKFANLVTLVEAKSLFRM
jgi:hypothetical protein